MKKVISILSILLLTCAHNSKSMMRKLSRAKRTVTRLAKKLPRRNMRTFHSSQNKQFDALKFFRIVKQQEEVLIERWGKYDRTLSAGLHFTKPIIESARNIKWSGRRIDLRELVYELPSQRVITKDNVAMVINGLVYYEVINSHQATYNIQNLPVAIEKLSQTTLRNIIGSMHLDDTLTSRDIINTTLCDALGDKGTKEWGIKIRRVELQDINPPKDIEKAMEKQMVAERYAREIKIKAAGEKEAAILSAEGEQRSAILRAEGDKTSRILRAEGQAQERLKKAEAEQKAIEMVQQALPDQNSAHYMIAMQYLNTLPKVTEGKGKIVVPVEMNAISGLFGSINTLLKNGTDLMKK